MIPSVDSTPVEAIEQDKVIPPPAAIEEVPADKPEDINWRAFREARKKDRAEKEAAEKRAAEKEAEAAALKAAMEAAFAKSSPQQQSQGYDYENESEDEKIEKRVRAILAEREAELDRQRYEREHNEYPQRLQQSFPDFSTIVNADTLDYLEYHYPEIAGPLKRLPDSFEKWSDAYRAIKKFVPNAQTAREDAYKASQNANKPKSLSSQAMTHNGQQMSPNVITEERRRANWERMQRTLKGIG